MAMTPARLDEIDALAAAATPGPWEITYDHDDRPDTGLSVKFPTAIGPFTWIEHPTPRDADDAEFIAAARTAVPELLAEVRRSHAAEAQALDDLATKVGKELLDRTLLKSARTASDHRTEAMRLRTILHLHGVDPDTGRSHREA